MMRIGRALVACLLVGVPSLAWAAGEIPVKGRVLDSAGKGVAKAAVSLIPVLPPLERRRLELAGEPAAAPGKAAGADADGRFQLRAPGPGAWKVVASGPGLATTEVDVSILLAPRELAALRLERVEFLKVKVMGKDGKPLAGARVVAVPAEGGRWRFLSNGQGAPSSKPVTTDAAGVATLEATADEPLQLVALPPGFPEIEKKVTPPGTTVELRAEAGCPRRLEVREAAGKPAAGALLASAHFALGVTDGDGRLTVTAPCREPWTLTIHGADGASAQTRLIPPPSAASEAPPVQKVVLAPPVKWVGRVLAAETRQPLAGAFVWVSGNPAGFVRTDARGSYQISLPAGAAGSPPPSFNAGLPDYFRSTEPAMAAAPAAGAVAAPTLLLKATAALAGVVVDRQGKPIAGAEVNAEEAAAVGPRAFPRQFVTSDDQGAFRIRVMPGKSYTLRAVHARFAPAKLVVAGRLAPLATRSGIRLTMEPGLAAFGKVVDGEQKPVAGAELTLSPVEPGAARRFVFLGFPPAESYSAVSAGDGSFQLEHLPAGRFDLAAKAEGYAPLTVRGLTLGERPEAKDLGTMVLVPGAVLEGVVVDGKGRPLSGAAVWAQKSAGAGMSPIGDVPRDPGVREVRTKSDGRFTLDDLTPGEAVDLSVRLAGYLAGSQPRLAVPHEGLVRVVLELAARVSGRVVDEASEPVGGATVSVQAVGGGLAGLVAGRLGTSDAEGRFQVDDLGVGKRTVTAEAAGFLDSEPRVIELVNGQEIADLELVLTRGAALEGVVTLPGGVPATGAQVALGGGNAEIAGVVFIGASGTPTDGDGHYRIEGVKEGPQSVEAELPGYRRAAKDLEVHGGTNRLDFQLGEGFTISGRVIDPSGRPVADVALQLTSNGALPLPAGNEVSGTDGGFRFGGLSGGRFGLSASKAGYAGARQEVQVTDASIDNVEITLTPGGVIAGKVVGLEFRDISNLEVTAISRSPSPELGFPRRGQVDFEGKYRVEGVPAGEWQLRGTVAGSGRSAQKNVTLPEAGGLVEADLEFGGGLTLSGHITRAGKPVADARVSVSGIENETGSTSSSDATGAYRIEGLKPGSYRLSVAQLGLAAGQERQVSLETSQEVDVDLSTARLSGRVFEKGSGAPLANVRVTALPAAPGQEGALGPQSVSDASGTFTLENVETGSYRVQGSKEGYARAEARVEVTSPDARVEGVRLELAPETGLVLDVGSPAGAPAQVSVALLDAAGSPVFSDWLATGENGRTRIRNAPPGHHQLLVAATGFAPVSLQVTVPGPPVPIQLQPGGQLIVEVRELATAGQTAKLTLVGANGQPHRTVSFGAVVQEWTLVAGAATVDDLPAGKWVVRIAGPNGKSWQGEVMAVAGGSVRRAF